jgi:ISXO2-like transposase domain
MAGFRDRPVRPVEGDGAYFGAEVRQASRKAERKDRRLAADQSGKRRVVAVMREHGGRTLRFVFRAEDEAVPTTRERVATGTTVYAYEAAAWEALHARFDTRRINHSIAFSDDGACTNQAESYFARLRRAEWGQHHHISGKYLGAYAREMAWQEDTRRRPNGARGAARAGGRRGASGVAHVGRLLATRASLLPSRPTAASGAPVERDQWRRPRPNIRRHQGGSRSSSVHSYPAPASQPRGAGWDGPDIPPATGCAMRSGSRSCAEWYGASSRSAERRSGLGPVWAAAVAACAAATASWMASSKSLRNRSKPSLPAVSAASARRIASRAPCSATAARASAPCRASASASRAWRSSAARSSDAAARLSASSARRRRSSASRSRAASTASIGGGLGSVMHLSSTGSGALTVAAVVPRPVTGPDTGLAGFPGGGSPPSRAQCAEAGYLGLPRLHQGRYCAAPLASGPGMKVSAGASP